MLDKVTDVLKQNIKWNYYSMLSKGMNDDVVATLQ